MYRIRVSPHERALKRAGVGPLKKTLVKPSTLRAYHDALRIFYHWLRLRFFDFLWPEDGDDLDQRVCEYGEAAWEEGESRAALANLVSGIRHFEEALQPPMRP